MTLTSNLISSSFSPAEHLSLVSTHETGSPRGEQLKRPSPSVHHPAPELRSETLNVLVGTGQSTGDDGAGANTTKKNSLYPD